MRKVVLCGCGALGSHTAAILRSAKDVELVLIDMDRVEAKNCLSQFFGKPSLGKNKAEALKQQLQFLWGVKAEARAVKLVKSNVDVLLKGADLVIDCLDNAEGRYVVRGWAYEEKAELLHGALAANGEYGVVAWTDRFEIDQEVEGAATCEGGEFLPFIVVVASYLAEAAKRFLEKGERVSFRIHPQGSMRL